MIVKMRKITVICHDEHREQAVLDLQELGVLHLNPVRPYTGHLLEEMRAHSRDAQRAAEVLWQYASKGARMLPSHTRSGLAPETVVDEVWKRINLKNDLEEQLAFWERERKRILPFGEFNPDTAKQLADKGIHVGLYRTGPRKDVPRPDDASVHTLHRDRHGVYFVVVSRDPDIEIDAEKVPFPETSLQGIHGKIKDTRREIRENEQALLDLAGYYRDVAEFAHLAEDKVNFLEARAGMGVHNPVTWLEGFCPERDVQSMRLAANAYGWGLLIEDPSPDDPTPTKVENPRWVRPIRVIMDFIGVVPGYREVDISMLFLLFFSFFFAVIVGDAGYGLIFLGLTFWARRRFKQWPSAVFNLLLITSTCTIIWGVLSGNYFGIEALPEILKSARLEALNDDNTVMLLCFLVGAVHLTLAHMWNVARFINSPRFLAQIGWIGTTWTMFFAARSMVLGEDFPPVMIPVFAAGVLMIVLFMTPWNKFTREWFHHVVLPLNLVSNFVDVVSYVRLFAVGTATYAVAHAFNQMGMELGAGGIISGIMSGIIIFFGHVLNILLATMGVLVHGIRLNTLEFAGHLGLQWSGARYAPFKRTSQSDLFFGELIKDENA